MLIKALSVEAVGRFANAAHIEGFGAGVNVLPAGNEVGKSTLFRAMRTCLFSRHDSKTQDIKDLASDDSQLPATVQLSFERNSRSYVIRKAFLRSPSATLTEDGREIARGKHADEAIWELLGISRGSGRTIDEGAFGVLWVGQGASFAPPTPAAGASSMLNAAIEAEVGTLVGGERARLVLEEVSGELKRHVTDTERPRSDGPFHSALRDIERWRAAEAFDRLSNGTREQIAVLVRLAMGARLAERGEAAPIILDDALVYCDDDRIERMFDALSRAGKNQQIIVLTCRLRSFGPLGGHTLRVNDTGRTDTVLRSFACRR